MRVWVAGLLINLALVLGVTVGYVRWGARLAELERELAPAPAPTLAPAPASGPREWRVRGVVRASLPELSLLVLSHEDIPGFMTPMTMGFRTASPGILAGLQVGDTVWFTLRGTPPDVAITAVEPAP